MGAPQATKTQATKAPQMAGSVACSDSPNSIAKTEEGQELFCKDLAPHCLHETNGPTIKRFCPATCGVCPVGDASANQPNAKTPAAVKAPQGVKAPQAVKAPAAAPQGVKAPQYAKSPQPTANAP